MDTHDLDDGNQQSVHLHARVPGAFLQQGSDVQDIFLDQSQIFVFKDEAA
jgi:hypothetical protein